MHRGGARIGNAAGVSRSGRPCGAASRVAGRTRRSRASTRAKGNRSSHGRRHRRFPGVAPSVEGTADTAVNKFSAEILAAYDYASRATRGLGTGVGS